MIKLNTYLTERVIQCDGVMQRFAGIDILAASWLDAEFFLTVNGFVDCYVVGILVERFDA